MSPRSRGAEPSGRQSTSDRKTTEFPPPKNQTVGMKQKGRLGEPKEVRPAGPFAFEREPPHHYRERAGFSSLKSNWFLPESAEMLAVRSDFTLYFSGIVLTRSSMVGSPSPIMLGMVFPDFLQGVDLNLVVLLGHWSETRREGRSAPPLIAACAGAAPSAEDKIDAPVLDGLTVIRHIAPDPHRLRAGGLGATLQRRKEHKQT